MNFNNGEDPAKEKKSIGGVHQRRIKRNKKTGELQEEGDITAKEMYEDDYRRAKEAKPGSGSFEGSAAPRVGGVKVQKTGMATGGTKSQVKASKKRVRRNSASPQAKASAKKLYD